MGEEGYIIDGTNWTLDMDEVNEVDLSGVDEWEEKPSGLKETTGTLEGFVSPKIEVEFECIHWDGDYLVMKAILPSDDEEPSFGAYKWTNEDLNLIEIKNLPKDVKSSISKEMI